MIGRVPSKLRCVALLVLATSAFAATSASGCGGDNPLTRRPANGGNPGSEGGVRHCSANAECASGLCGGDGLCK
jgi:hypothetical protein